MKIKMHTRERTIKLRDSKKAAAQALRRVSIKQLIQSTKAVDTQTVEGDAADTSEKATVSALQKISAVRHITARSAPKTQIHGTGEAGSDPAVEPSAATGAAHVPNVNSISNVYQARANTTAASWYSSASLDAEITSIPEKTSQAPIQRMGAKPVQTSIVRTKKQQTIVATKPEAATRSAQNMASATPSRIREGQAAALKCNRTDPTAIKTPAATIQPKGKAVATKQSTALVTKWRAARTQRLQPQKAAAAQAVAAKRVTKTERIANVLKSVLTTSAKSIGQLGAALFGGAAGILVPLILIALIGGLLCSPMGIFFSGEADNDLTIQTVLTELNTELNERITEIENTVAHDDLQQSGTQASQKDILAVYAVKITTDPDNPLDAVTMDEQRAEILREIYWAMNTIDYTTETYTEEETVLVPSEGSADEEGTMVEQTQTVERTRLIITISGKTAQEMAEEYGFNKEQLGYVTELLSEEYDELWTMLSVPGGGSDDIVAVALCQVGNVGGEPYWSWYGFSSRVAWCACFVSWCADQCGYIESGVMPKFSYCDAGIAWFKTQGRWQERTYIPAPGDIIFFDWGLDGVSDHVGIVESCDGTTVYTVEGNANDNVKQLSYPVGYAKIMGYGVPNYG